MSINAPVEPPKQKPIYSSSDAEASSTYLDIQLSPR
jgi:hypothetical protein